MRTLFGILFGLATAMLMVETVNRLGLSLYPLSISPETADPDTLASIVVNMPVPAKLIVVLGWLIGAFGGVWITLRICDHRWAGWPVVIAVMAIANFDVAALPHPLWMKLCAVILPIAGGVLAGRLHRKPYPGEALLG